MDILIESHKRLRFGNNLKQDEKVNIIIPIIIKIPKTKLISLIKLTTLTSKRSNGQTYKKKICIRRFEIPTLKVLKELYFL